MRVRFSARYASLALIVAGFVSLMNSSTNSFFDSLDNLDQIKGSSPMVRKFPLASPMKCEDTFLTNPPVVTSSTCPSAGIGATCSTCTVSYTQFDRLEMNNGQPGGYYYSNVSCGYMVLGVCTPDSNGILACQGTPTAIVCDSLQEVKSQNQ